MQNENHENHENTKKQMNTEEISKKSNKSKTPLISLSFKDLMILLNLMKQVYNKNFSLRDINLAFSDNFYKDDYIDDIITEIPERNFSPKWNEIWDRIAQYEYLDEKYIEVFEKYLPMETILCKQKLSEEFLINYVENNNANDINWNFISSKQKLSDEFIENYKINLNLSYVIESQFVSEKTMDKIYDVLPDHIWSTFIIFQSEFQNLSEISNQFILKYLNQLTSKCKNFFQIKAIDKYPIFIQEKIIEKFLNDYSTDKYPIFFQEKIIEKFLNDYSTKYDSNIYDKFRFNMFLKAYIELFIDFDYLKNILDKIDESYESDESDESYESDEYITNKYEFKKPWLNLNKNTQMIIFDYFNIEYNLGMKEINDRTDNYIFIKIENLIKRKQNSQRIQRYQEYI